MKVWTRQIIGTTVWTFSLEWGLWWLWTWPTKETLWFVQRWLKYLCVLLDSYPQECMIPQDQKVSFIEYHDLHKYASNGRQGEMEEFHVQLLKKHTLTWFLKLKHTDLQRGETNLPSAGSSPNGLNGQSWSGLELRARSSLLDSHVGAGTSTWVVPCCFRSP